jgi:hypothetical protein
VFDDFTRGLSWLCHEADNSSPSGTEVWITRNIFYAPGAESQLTLLRVSYKNTTSFVLPESVCAEQSPSLARRSVGMSPVCSASLHCGNHEEKGNSTYPMTFIEFSAVSFRA